MSDEEKHRSTTFDFQPARSAAYGILVIIIVIILIWAALSFLPHGNTDDDHTITLYGFSVKGEVFDDRIIPAFREHWNNRTGENIEITSTYAGSGGITGQVINGAPAEVMILSTEWDAIRLREHGMVTTDWNSFPHNGTISTSPWVILTRDGNPKNIRDFHDLSGDDIEIVHADPVTSGGACWSIFSIYGSELRSTDNEEDAEELLDDIMDNVISWQSSARAALSQFMLGYGDAIITYENDALLAIEKGEEVEIVYPTSTIYSEHKVVMVDRNVNEDELELIDEFIDFLFTPHVQSFFIEKGFRAPDTESDTITPRIEDPFTVEYLGGWEQAHERLIDDLYVNIRKGGM